MNFTADASVAGSLVALLRRRGHTVVAIRDIRPDMPDEDVLQTAHSRDGVLITEDKDFGDLVVRQRRQTHGVVLLRLSGVARSERAAFACVQLERLGERLRGTLTVIEAGQVRVRTLG